MAGGSVVLEKLRPVIDIIRDSRTHFLATVSEERQPHVRPMLFHLMDDGRLWGATPGNTTKIDELRTNPRVELCFVDDLNRFARIQGTASLLDGAPEKQRLWQVSPSVRKNFEGPEDPRLLIIEVAAKKVLWQSEIGERYNTIEL